MRNLIALLSLAISMIAFAPKESFALDSLTIRTMYSTAGVNGTTWVPLITNSVRTIKGIAIYDTSGHPIQVGYAGHTSSANSEQAAFTNPLGSATFQAGSYYPLSVSTGQRISIRAADSAGSIFSGENIITFFYN